MRACACGGWGLTGNGSEDVGDEDLHHGLVHQVVAGAHPLDHRLRGAQCQQLRPRQPLLDLAHTAAAGEYRRGINRMKASDTPSSHTHTHTDRHTPGDSFVNTIHC